MRNGRQPMRNRERKKEREREREREKKEERMTNVKETKTVCSANFFPFFD